MKYYYHIMLLLLMPSAPLTAMQGHHPVGLSEELIKEIFNQNKKSFEIPLNNLGTSSESSSADEEANDTAATTIPITSSDIIDLLDEKINQTYSQGTFIDFFNTLSEANMIDICSLVVQYCHNEQTTAHLFNSLYKKNKFVQKTIDALTQETLHNINGVTVNTITAVENQENTQPISILNTIPLCLKKFIMNRAKAEIDRHYSLAITFPNIILCFHICPSKNLAVAALQDKSIALWDLNIAEHIAYIINETCTHLICFNPKGSHLASIDSCQSFRILKQWKIKQSSLKQTHEVKINCYHPIAHLSYYNDNSIIAIPEGSQQSTYSRQIFSPIMIKFKKNGTASYKGSTDLLLSKNSRLLGHVGSEYKHGSDKAIFDQPPYTAKLYFYTRDKDNNKRLIITKKDCFDLYLCEQAIQNSPTTQSQKIEQSASYQRLTEYEKGKVQKKIDEKMAIATASNPETKELFRLNVFS